MKQQKGATNVVNFAEKSEQEKHYPQLHNALDRALHHLWKVVLVWSTKGLH